jgi:hypothetical protein
MACSGTALLYFTVKVSKSRRMRCVGKVKAEIVPVLKFQAKEMYGGVEVKLQGLLILATYVS